MDPRGLSRAVIDPDSRWIRQSVPSARDPDIQIRSLIVHSDSRRQALGHVCRTIVCTTSRYIQFLPALLHAEVGDGGGMLGSRDHRSKNQALLQSGAYLPVPTSSPQPHNDDIQWELLENFWSGVRPASASQPLSQFSSRPYSLSHKARRKVKENKHVCVRHEKLQNSNIVDRDL